MRRPSVRKVIEAKFGYNSEAGEISDTLSKSAGANTKTKKKLSGGIKKSR
jgi:hypothetical protein